MRWSCFESIKIPCLVECSCNLSMWKREARGSQIPWKSGYTESLSQNLYNK